MDAEEIALDTDSSTLHYDSTGEDSPWRGSAIRLLPMQEGLPAKHTFGQRYDHHQRQFDFCGGFGLEATSIRGGP